MDAYSQDLRERVARACDAGEMSQREVAEAFGVSLSFITKLLRRRRSTGSVAAKPHAGGRTPLMSQVDCRRVRELIRQQPDATLAECCQSMADQGATRVSLPTMCRVLDKLGLHRKKRVFTPPSGRLPG
jgi:transposase